MYKKAFTATQTKEAFVATDEGCETSRQLCKLRREVRVRGACHPHCEQVHRNAGERLGRTCRTQASHQ